MLNISKNRLTSLLIAISFNCLSISSMGLVFAQDIQNYPSKPIHLVVGFATGGISDVLARTLSAKITEQTGQAVIVENRPGAGTTIAADYITKAAPDGYTLFLQDMTTHAINTALYKKLPFDSIKDFTPITLVASTPLILVIPNKLNITNLKDFIAFAKKSNNLSYSSSGNGAITHLAAETFNRLLNIQPVHVPFKGSSLSTQAVLSGDVTFSFSSMPPAVTLIQGKKIVALGVTTNKRVATTPEIPTIAEAGLPGFEIVLYSGILAPKGMSPELAQKIQRIFVNAASSPEVKQVYLNIGANLVTNNSTEFVRQMTEESQLMAKAVKLSGAQID